MQDVNPPAVTPLRRLRALFLGFFGCVCVSWAIAGQLSPHATVWGFVFGMACMFSVYLPWKRPRWFETRTFDVLFLIVVIALAIAVIGGLAAPAFQ